MNNRSENEWVRVGAADAIDEDDVIQVHAFGKNIALYCVEHKHYATDDLCTHENAALSEGYLDGTVIECPLHQGAFCIKTGKALRAPAEKALTTYEVKVEGGAIFIRQQQ